MKRGFTLIELLFVIALIAVLSAAILIAFGAPKTDSRNSARLSQVREVEKALEVYISQVGVYPNTLSDLVSQGVLSEFPSIPDTGTGQTQIAYVPLGSSVCTSYHLGVILEPSDAATRVLGTDEDRAPGMSCTGADDFHGSSLDCRATSAEDDACYDVGP